MSKTLRQRPVAIEMPAYGIFVEESIHHPSFHMDWRTDTYAKLILVFSGQGWLHRKDDTLSLQGPTVCAIPARYRHRLEDATGAPMSLYLICLDLQQVAFSEIGRKLVDKLHKSPINAWLSSGDDTVRQVLYEQTTRHEGYRELITGLVGSFLVRLLREADAESSARDSVERVRAYVVHMAQNFFTKQSLDEAARLCGLSRRRFSQLFRELAGQSWNERIIDLRIGHACHLLKNSGRSVQSVAYESGFENLAHFYRTFQHRVGTTPSRYREQYLMV